MAEIQYEPSGCNCDGTDYTKTDIQNAASKALQLASQGQTIGRDRYPHAYNDYEHFSFTHAQAPYLEFPILQNGAIYDGSSPGADRVVIGSIAADYQSAVYCAVITHDGQQKNGFAECADDSMNVRGKGTYGGKAAKGGHHHGHRELLKRIDL
ncbi:MAG: hypothetical protein M1819_001940 [Sarea resinae]|nr:MAG: hypothetical protein M1819_001940 [Sarea resinae]